MMVFPNLNQLFNISFILMVNLYFLLHNLLQRYINLIILLLQKLNLLLVLPYLLLRLIDLDLFLDALLLGLLQLGLQFANLVLTELRLNLTLLFQFFVQIMDFLFESADVVSQNGVGTNLDFEILLQF